MPFKALLIQTLIATALWAVGVSFLFGKSLQELLPGALIFAALYWVVARVLAHVMAKKDPKS